MCCGLRVPRYLGTSLCTDLGTQVPRYPDTQSTWVPGYSLLECVKPMEGCEVEVLIAEDPFFKSFS